MKNCKCKDFQVPEMQRMCNVVRMSRELKERELIEKAKQGDKSALLALYEQYTPLFKKLCRNRASYCNVLEVDDLLQECFIALKQAVKHYSFDADTSFMSYLYTCIKRYLSRVTARLSYIPAYQLQIMLEIKQFRDDYEKEHGRKPDDGMIMHEFYISADCLRELDALKDLKVTSLDVPIDEEGENTLSDLLPGANDLEEKAIRSLSVVQFWELLDALLLPAESEIIKLIYLDNMTIAQVSEFTGDTEKQVRRLQQQALRKLRMRRTIKEIV